MRVTVNQRRVLQRSRGGNQNVHCGDVSGRAGSQTNRFAPHGSIHVHNLTQQGAVTVQFCGTARWLHAELMQAQFKLVAREDGSRPRPHRPRTMPAPAPRRVLRGNEPATPRCPGAASWPFVGTVELVIPFPLANQVADGVCPCKYQSSLLTHPGRADKSPPCRASCALSILERCITS